MYLGGYRYGRTLRAFLLLAPLAVLANDSCPDPQDVCAPDVSCDFAGPGLDTVRLCRETFPAPSSKARPRRVAVDSKLLFTERIPGEAATIPV